MAGVFSVLVLAQPSADIDDLLEPLLSRHDLGLLRVATAAAAQIALRDVAVNLVLVCPETKPVAVASVIDMTEALRPGTPILLLRVRGADTPAGWGRRTLAILRCPIFSDVLSKTIDIALGLRRLPQ